MCAPQGIISACAFSSLLAGAALAVNIATVPVGNPGNLGELSGTASGSFGPTRVCGSVNHAYNIGKYEVTAGQYTDFLNAVAKNDKYFLYDSYMSGDSGCKIIRGGAPGRWEYSVAPEYANRPVTYVSWGDAARFVNWLHNGQPVGAQGLNTTEDGAYFLNGALTNEQLLAVNREADWRWAIPSEDEWYKAAYYDPSTSSYFDYPTSSNSISTEDANFGGSVGHTTDVGFYGKASPYGTFDQGGNWWEWTEAVINNTHRVLRGGTFSGWDTQLQAAYRSGGYPSFPGGFRVVQVPEPAATLMLVLGGLAVIRYPRGATSHRPIC